jgi:hypothetical protein
VRAHSAFFSESECWDISSFLILERAIPVASAPQISNAVWFKLKKFPLSRSRQTPESPTRSKANRSENELTACPRDSTPAGGSDRSSGVLLQDVQGHQGMQKREDDRLRFLGQGN